MATTCGAVYPWAGAWSPWVAQSVGYGILIITLSRCGWGEFPELQRIAAAETPPPFILLKIGTATLFICLWYDNVLVLSDNLQIHEIFHSKFRSTCADFTIKLKHWDSYGGTPFLISQIDPEKPEAPHLPEYLGLQFGLSLKRSRKECHAWAKELGRDLL